MIGFDCLFMWMFQLFLWYWYLESHNCTFQLICFIFSAATYDLNTFRWEREREREREREIAGRKENIYYKFSSWNFVYNWSCREAFHEAASRSFVFLTESYPMPRKLWKTFIIFFFHCRLFVCLFVVVCKFLACYR